MENLKLDKLIVVFLSVDDISRDLLEQVAFSVKGFQTKFKNREPIIYTTQTRAISSRYMEAGYDIKVISEGKEILFSRLLGYDENGAKSFGREIRPAQNWEKMLYSGCFDIPHSWEYQDNGHFLTEEEYKNLIR